jgi:hypothetical protein
MAKIDVEQAENKMFELLAKEDMGDRIYEFAQDIFQSCINVVETNSEIDDRDLDSTEEWYDEIQDDFYQSVYEKMTEFLTSKDI